MLTWLATLPLHSFEVKRESEEDERPGKRFKKATSPLGLAKDAIRYARVMKLSNLRWTLFFRKPIILQVEDYKEESIVGEEKQDQLSVDL